MSLQRVITTDEAEWTVLSKANELGKFAVPIDQFFAPDAISAAFERGMVERWYTLIDVSRLLIAGRPDLCRVYLLTDAGKQRLAALKAIFAP